MSERLALGQFAWSKSPDRIFGFLEHLRETRFTVPKITSSVTRPFAKHLENLADLRAACSKNARIRAAWPHGQKFQKSLSGLVSEKNSA
jgi:hypothetical protein